MDLREQGRKKKQLEDQRKKFERGTKTKRNLKGFRKEIKSREQQRYKIKLQNRFKRDKFERGMKWIRVSNDKRRNN